MVAPYWTGSTISVEPLDSLNKLCCARLNKLCCARLNKLCCARFNKLCFTWLLIGQATVPDQSVLARPN